MVAQRDKLHELPSPEIVGIPCARSGAVKATLLHGKQFFYFFSQPIVFKRRKRVHGLVADEGEIAEVLLCFGDSFVVKSYLELSTTPLFSADQVLLYFSLRGFREFDRPVFYLRLQFKQVLTEGEFLLGFVVRRIEGVDVQAARESFIFTGEPCRYAIAGAPG
jgi:hypothetical protein